jgi:hypothetical protein
MFSGFEKQSYFERMIQEYGKKIPRAVLPRVFSDVPQKVGAFARFVLVFLGVKIILSVQPTAPLNRRPRRIMKRPHRLAAACRSP